MATCLISRRMFAITLMTTLALTAVARPIFAADDEAADLVPGETEPYRERRRANDVS